MTDQTANPAINPAAPEATALEQTGAPEATPETPPIVPVYKLTIADNVVEKIAARAVARIDGIVAMKGNLFSTIQEGFGGNSQTKGVSADLLDDNSARVELDVILEYGKSAVNVFEQVKNVVVNDLQMMTGLIVSELDVNVVDVMSAEEYGRKKGDDRRREAREARENREAASELPAGDTVREAAAAGANAPYAEPTPQPQRASATVVNTGF